ncbi:MAG: ThuA domain-containing protein [Opitutaceae bacterium]|nr:ThuA domain-containing protein [Opitutaceae bacterium]
MKPISFPPALGALVATVALVPVLRAEETPNRTLPPANPAKTALIDAAIPKEASAKPAKQRHLLICARTEGFYHESIPVGLYALQALGERTGAYTSEVNNEMSAFTAENLARFDGIIFFNTTQLKFENPARRQALLEFVRGQGKAVIGIHAASDNFPNWPEGQGLMGGVFHSHPWHGTDTVAVKVDEPEHPVVRAFNGRGFWITDEIYQIVGPYSRETERTLLSLDMGKQENQRPKEQIVRTDNDFPIAWVKFEGLGRVFYSSLGHNEHIYWDSRVLRHFLDGIQFAVGDLAAEAKPVKKGWEPVHAPAPAAPLASLENLLTPLLATPDQSENTTLRSIEARLRDGSVADRTALLAQLAAEASKATVHERGRTMLSSLFGQFGSDAQVALLAGWAGEGSDAAVRALAKINSAAAVDALVKLLDSPRAPKVAVINGLELTHSPAGVAALAGILKGGSPAEAVAARDALARIPSQDALAALRQAGQFTSDKDLAWAVLTSAWTNGPSDKRSLDAVRSLLVGTEDQTLRAAAANTLIQLGGEQALIETIPLLKNEVLALRVSTAWMLQAGATQAKGAIAALAEQVTQLPTNVQFALASLAEQQQRPLFRPLLHPLLGSADAEIRKTALAAWSVSTQSAADVVPLVDALSRPEDKAAGIAGLSRMKADGLETWIREKISSESNPGLLAAWLTIASNRVDNAVMPHIIKALSSEVTEVRQAGFRALKPLVRGEDLDLLLGLRSQLKTPAERRAWQEATVNAIAFRNDTAAVVALIDKELPTATTSERTAFILALANMETSESLGIISRELNNPSMDHRKEIIRALSSVRKYPAVPLLLDAAQKATDSSERILALRGALDTLFGLIELPSLEKFTSYKRAWELSERKEEKDAIIKLTDWLWDAESRKWAEGIKAEYLPKKI